MTFSYVVQKGDTLGRIARRYAINCTSLISANPQLKESEYLVPGQVIHVPLRAGNLYVVQAGDSIFEIARRFNIVLGDLIEANSQVDPRRLRIGQTMVLPISRGINIVDTTIEYGYSEMMEHLRELRSIYPFLQVEYIGETVMGKKIPAVRIGNGPKEVHYNGSFHANEWITSMFLMKFIEDYAKALSTDGMLKGVKAKQLYEDTSLWIVPMVNPDGVELTLEGISPQHPLYEQLLRWNEGLFCFKGWKANIHGVDLNDQFPAYWEEEKKRRSPSGPGPRDYVGVAPLSEPEAIAMAEFTRSHDFRLVIAFHTQGEEIYWNYRDYEPEEAEWIAARLAEGSGYKSVKLSGSDAGYKDWFIQEFGKPGFTVEAGSGTNPLPISEFRNIYPSVLELMIEGLKV
jgi:g-D-glutamyl-meso-diaminopimelate peptidase